MPLVAGINVERNRKAHQNWVLAPGSEPCVIDRSSGFLIMGQFYMTASLLVTGTPVSKWEKDFCAGVGIDGASN